MKLLYIVLLLFAFDGLVANSPSETNLKTSHKTRNKIRNPFAVLKKHQYEPIDPVEFWVFLGVSGILVIFGGIFAGLTMGLMSLDSTNLSILKASGSAKEKTYAERIEPIKKNTHLLLVTLLLCNTVVNETLPVLLHTIHLDGYQAVLISTALIVVFGEIIPQAVCVRYGLSVGAFFAWPVRILMMLLLPISWPIAKLLDWILGHKDGVIYRRAELSELVNLHGEDNAGTLNRDEVSIVRAVLELRDKTVSQVMTPIKNVYMLPISTQLNMQTIESIIQKGHSRVPIYCENRCNVIGVVLVKSLVIYDPKDNVLLSSVKIRRLPRISANTPLFDVLHIFEEGGSHMALVVDEASPDIPTFEQLPLTSSPLWTNIENSDNLPKRYVTLGIVTLEDIIEELIGAEIIDETDEYVNMTTKQAVFRESTQNPGFILSPPSVESSPRFEVVDHVYERTPLLSNAEPISAKPSPALRPKNSKKIKEYKDKELIEASKLAEDIAILGQSVRPSSFFSRQPSEIGDQEPRQRLPPQHSFISMDRGTASSSLNGDRDDLEEWLLDGEKPGELSQK